MFEPFPQKNNLIMSNASKSTGDFNCSIFRSAEIWKRISKTLSRDHVDNHILCKKNFLNKQTKQTKPNKQKNPRRIGCSLLTAPVSMANRILGREPDSRTRLFPYGLGNGAVGEKRQKRPPSLGLLFERLFTSI